MAIWHGPDTMLRYLGIKGRAVSPSLTVKEVGDVLWAVLVLYQ